MFVESKKKSLKSVEKFTKRFLKSTLVRNIILIVIILDSVVLGFLTLNNNFLPRIYLIYFDKFCICFFIFEMFLKITIYKKAFFKSNWNTFDFIIVVLASIPFIIGSDTFSFSENIIIFRLLIMIKILRLFSAIKELRRVIKVISRSIPSILCIGILLLLVYYIYAIFGTRTFGAIMPEYFGNLGQSFFTLFQVMAGENWSEAIARPIMKIYPYAWIYFISFIVIVSFIVLNIIIGIIVDSFDEIKKQELKNKK
ncbi:MAG: ion transporter [Helicobacter sp.]|nr:ion transporter [Helicobacter sp.]